MANAFWECVRVHAAHPESVSSCLLPSLRRDVLWLCGTTTRRTDDVLTQDQPSQQQEGTPIQRVLNARTHTCTSKHCACVCLCIVVGVLLGLCVSQNRCVVGAHARTHTCTEMHWLAHTRTGDGWRMHWSRRFWFKGEVGEA